MKTTTWFLVGMSVLLIACAENNQYTLEVFMHEGNDSVIALNTENAPIIDGYAIFHGTLTHYPQLMSLGVPFSGEKRTPIILEPGTIQVNFTEDEGFRIGGTPNNDLLQSFNEILKPYFDQMSLYRHKWSRMRETTDIEAELQRQNYWESYELATEKLADKHNELIAGNANYAGLTLTQFVLRFNNATTIGYHLDHFRAFPEDPIYVQMQERYKKLSRVTDGHQIADFSLPDKLGNMVSLSDFKGRWVLIDFWFVDCVWCRAMTPHLINLYNDWNVSRDFEIIGISVDRQEHHARWLKAVEEDGAPWVQLLDSSKAVAEDVFGVRGYPTMFLIDKEGKGTITLSGYQEENALRRKLGELVKKD